MLTQTKVVSFWLCLHVSRKVSFTLRNTYNFEEILTFFDKVCDAICVDNFAGDCLSNFPNFDDPNVFFPNSTGHWP